jgi:hypothetical protein
MNKPNGTDLLQTLIKLLAEQEGVTIQCETTGKEKDEK